MTALAFRRVTLDPGRASAPVPDFEVPDRQAVGVEAQASVSERVVRLAVGMERAGPGQVQVLGVDPRSLDRYGMLTLRRRLGAASSNDGLVSNLSLRANLIVPLIYGARTTRREAEARVDEALAELELAHLANRRPAELHHEARAIATVARAALGQPELLLVDHLASRLPRPVGRSLLLWCRGRVPSMLILLAGPASGLGDVLDRVLDPLGAREGLPQ